jgi:hypothetical protein
VNEIPKKTMKQDRKTFKIIHSLDEIPSHFDSEDDERDFWAEHELSEELWDSLTDATEELDRIAPLPDGKKKSRRAS